MTHWQDRLREADEALTRELSPDETQRLRRTIVAAAATTAGSRRWSLPFALTAGSLATASIALVLATVIASPAPAGSSDNDLVTSGEAALEPPSPEGERRQLQFATPGGTRIIWVFDSEFDVKGTLP